MEQYIPKSALVAEINRLIELLNPFLGACAGQIVAEANAKLSVLEKLKNFIDTLEVKEVDDELQGIEKEVAEGNVNAIDRKRIPIVLKGEIKHKFKNEFNTLWQTVDGIQFANVAKHVIERLCLHFAAWGVYNLKGYCSISSEEKHKMDIEVKEVDEQKEISFQWSKFCLNGKDKDSFVEVAKHFFELGLKAQKGE